MGEKIYIYCLASTLSFPRNDREKTADANARKSRQFDLGALSSRERLHLPRNGPDQLRGFYSINSRRRGARDPTATNTS